MNIKQPQSGERGRSRLPNSVRRVLLLSLLGVGACATPPVASNGCIGQSDAVLAEIASGSLDEHNPATAAWEREWHRDCPDREGDRCLLGGCAGIARGLHQL